MLKERILLILPSEFDSYSPTSTLACNFSQSDFRRYLLYSSQLENLTYIYIPYKSRRV